jgi:hypothetical protein
VKYGVSSFELEKLSERSRKGICGLDDFTTMVELMLRNHRSEIKTSANLMATAYAIVPHTSPLLSTHFRRLAGFANHIQIFLRLPSLSQYRLDDAAFAPAILLHITE